MSTTEEVLGPPLVRSGITRNGGQRTTAAYQFRENSTRAAEQSREELDRMLNADTVSPLQTPESQCSVAVKAVRDAEVASWQILAVSDEDLAAASIAVDNAQAHVDTAQAALFTARSELGMAEGQLKTAKKKLEALQAELAAALAAQESEIRSGCQIESGKVGLLRVQIDAQQRTVEMLRQVAAERKRPIDVARRAFEAASEALAFNKHDHAILAYHHAAAFAAAEMLAKLRPALEHVEDTMVSVPLHARMAAQRQVRQCGERLLCTLGRIMPFEAIVTVVSGRLF